MLEHGWRIRLTSFSSCICLRWQERKMLNGLSLCCMDAERFSDAKRFCEMLLTLTEREDNIALVRNRLAAINSRCQASESTMEEGKQAEV